MSKLANLVDAAPAAAPRARRFWADAPIGSSLSPRRKAVALAIAGAADVAQLAFAPLFSEGAASPFEDALDAVVAVVLVGVVGFQWRLAAAFIAELVPGVSLFPSWTAVVLSLPVATPARPAIPPAP